MLISAVSSKSSSLYKDKKEFLLLKYDHKLRKTLTQKAERGNCQIFTADKNIQL